MTFIRNKGDGAIGPSGSKPKRVKASKAIYNDEAVSQLQLVDGTFSPIINNLTVNGTLTLSGPAVDSVDAAITATGTDDTDGYQLTEEFNVITGGAADTGVELMTAVAGMAVVIANLTASTKKVYPKTGASINDEAATTGFITLQPEQVVTLRAVTTTSWQSSNESESILDKAYLSAGTVSLPSLSFAADKDNGIYYIGANNYALSVAGSKVLELGSGAGGIAVTGLISSTTSVTATTSVSLGTDIIGVKEVDHELNVATTTTAATAGGKVTVRGGTGATSGAGGAVEIIGGTAGATAASIGGAVNVTSGVSGAGNGASGAVNLKSGAATASDTGIVTVASGVPVTTGNSGNVSVASGAGAATGNTGTVSVASGAATTGDSGTATLKTGNATTGSSGVLSVTTGTGTTATGKITASTGNATTTSGLVEIATGTATTTTGAITATTGNATTTSGAISLATGTAVTVGNISIVPGTASSTTVSPVVILGKGVVTKSLDSSVATGGAITGVQLVGGHISVTGGTGNLALPSAADITTAIGATPVGTRIEFVINAVGMTAANIVTLTMGANIVTQKMISAGDSATDQLLTVTNTSNVNMGIFRLCYITATTCSLHRIG